MGGYGHQANVTDTIYGNLCNGKSALSTSIPKQRSIMYVENKRSKHSPKSEKAVSCVLYERIEDRYSFLNTGPEYMLNYNRVLYIKNHYDATIAY